MTAPLLRPTAEAEALTRGLDGLMVFDAVCNVCSGCVQLVAALDQRAAIRFSPMQSPYGGRLCEVHGVDPRDPSTFLFFDNGRALEATDAIAAMLKRLPAPWRWLSALTLLPRPLRDGFYRWVARNRYWLLGKRKTCMIPAPGIMARFVETLPASADQ